MIYLITGKAGAGKSEYAQRFKKELVESGKTVYWLDGDIWREQHKNDDYSDDGRISNLLSAAVEAGKKEREYDIVLLSFIAPRRIWRNMMRDCWIRSQVIYIPGGKLWEGTTYDMPDEEELKWRG